MFTFELHQLTEAVDCSKWPKDSTWEVLKRGLKDQDDASWSYATRINEVADEREREHQRSFEIEIGRIRDYIQPVVMFGIFLIAITILSVSVTAILNLRDAPPAITVPAWVKDWGWIVVISHLERCYWNHRRGCWVNLLAIGKSYLGQASQKSAWRNFFIAGTATGAA